MRAFKYELDLDKLGIKEETGKPINHKITFERFLEVGLASLYPQGLDNRTRRTYGRVLDKLDLSTDGVINLEEVEHELVSEVFVSDKTKFDVKQTRVVGLYAKAVEEAKKL